MARRSVRWTGRPGPGRHPLLAKPADQLGDDLVAAKGRHQVDALEQVARIAEQLARLVKTSRDAGRPSRGIRLWYRERTRHRCVAIIVRCSRAVYVPDGAQ